MLDQGKAQILAVYARGKESKAEPRYGKGKIYTASERSEREILRQLLIYLKSHVSIHKSTD